MKRIDLQEIRDSLVDREVQLNSGFGGDISDVIFKKVGFRPSYLVSEMYRSFDGFPEGVVDGGSCIRIWPLREVLSSLNQPASGSRIAFADFLMGSQEITIDFADDEQPVLYSDSGEQIASSTGEFLNGLAQGAFDFQ